MAFNFRARLGVTIIALFAIGVLALTVHFLWRGRLIMRHLYEPKITSLRIGGMPVGMDQIRPLEVMSGLAIELACESVRPSEEGEKASFRTIGMGAPVESPECNRTLTFVGKPGTKLTFAIEYRINRPGTAPRVTDRRDIQVILIAAGEYLRIRNLETRDGETIPTHTVPQEVVPYVEGALRLEGQPSDYAMLLFVRKINLGKPILQVIVPPENPQAFRANVMPVKWYRDFGGGIGGYAAWPGGGEPGQNIKAEPILVGNEEDRRQAFELYAGLFRVRDIAKITKRCLSLDTLTQGRAIFNVESVSIDDLKALAYRGWISPALTVVRTDQMPTESKTTWSVR